MSVLALSHLLQGLQQRNYTVTNKETPSIVELLKEFLDMSYGHRIRVHTDHKDTTQPNIASQRVMRWPTVVEEFAIELIYVKGTTNVAANALSRLPRDGPEPPETTNMMECFDLYETHTLSEECFP